MFDVVDIVYQVVVFDRKELRFNNMTNFIPKNVTTQRSSGGDIKKYRLSMG